MRKLNRHPLLMADVNTGGESSSLSDTQSGSANDGKQPIQGAGESSTPADVKPTALKDVVKGVLDKHAAAASSTVEGEKNANGAVLNENHTNAEAPIKEGAEGEKAGETKPAGDQPVVADENLPFGKHPRFQEIVKQKNTFESRVKELEPVATRMQAVESFCQQHGVQGEEFDNAVRLAALIKTNPMEAVKQLETVVNNLKYSVGAALPPDLQAEVDNGTMSESHAKEMLRLRVENYRAKGTVEQTTATANSRIENEVRQSIDTWVSSKVKQDPGFKAKASDTAPDGKFEFVNDRFMRLWQQVQPKSVAQVLELAERAYEEVSKFTAAQAPRQPVQRPPSPKRSAPEQQLKVDTSKPGWAKKVAQATLANHST